ncbi:MAG: DUF1801 domain-containing protein [Brevundimonas sp.]|nr:MAG: DUF1801 domain-containing protein [Brevundimonas sp.]
MTRPETVDAYIAGLPETSRAAAETVRRAIRKALPEAEERISYGIAAFRVGGRNVVYFGVWKAHIGLYPIARGDEAFEVEVGPFRAKTDTVQFALKAPMPVELIMRIAKAQAGSRP